MEGEGCGGRVSGVLLLSSPSSFHSHIQSTVVLENISCEHDEMCEVLTKRHQVCVVCVYVICVCVLCVHACEHIHTSLIHHTDMVTHACRHCVCVCACVRMCVHVCMCV